MLPILKFLLFIFINFSFGYLALSQITKIRSILLLVPLSASFGISAYLFIFHCLSFIIGPNSATLATIFILLLLCIIILFIKKKDILKPELEANINQTITLYATSIIIFILSFLAIYRFGIFDKDFHIPMTLSIFNNNEYPPLDYFRPSYVLLYHYGSNLLAGAIHNFCKFEISTSFEIISAALGSITFLSFFVLAWIITKNFKLSFLAAFCTYFGGGLLWLDAIIRYLSKHLPQHASDWTFLQTFFNLGIHGGILNAPSVLSFVSTYSIGFPLLILSIVLVWRLINESEFKIKILYIVFLNISLFSLFISANWLYATFWAGVILFLVILFLYKQANQIVYIISTFAISIILSKTIGNALFFQDVTHSLGRGSIYNIAIKEKLFSVTSWGRLNTDVAQFQSVPLFSWDFIAEFGLSLFLIPIIIIYLKKHKDIFSYLLLFFAITTMPIPLLFDFKISPVDLNRLFSFGNSMLILLITCSIGILFKELISKKIFIATYMLLFCLSPISELFSSIVFTPNITFEKSFSKAVTEDLKKVKSLNDFAKYYKVFSNSAKTIKNKINITYRDEIDYLKKNSKPGDVAISSISKIPLYAGVYTLVPPREYSYKDVLYSYIDNIYPTIITTLDPFLLNELNIKWILIDKEYKKNLSIETKNKLNNQEIFNLAYISKENQDLTDKKQIEIYHVNEIKDLQVDYIRKTAWLLLDENGQPIIELASSNENKIRLFPSSKNALLYLKDLYSTNPDFKKELITAQVIPINSLEEQISKNKLNIALDKRF